MQHIESEGIVAYIHVETKEQEINELLKQEQEINELLKQEETMWKQQPIVIFFTQRSIFLLLIILLIFTKHYVIMDDTLQNFNFIVHILRYPQHMQGKISTYFRCAFCLLCY